uniref:Trehalose 6-phosphate phosphatase n=1 Tax=Ananas comosus var. bracteatus TaxID=296719 RepID=A0A6V7P7V7_ANACO|nr:unnamed protein product [Ananas comosus var. bracteatus]
MTKQNVVMSEMGIAVAAAVPASSPLLTYPPPRSCSAVAAGAGGAGGGAGGGVAMRKKYQAPLEFGPAKMNPWVESMRASSPTHAKAAAALAEAAAAAEAAPGAAKDEYAAWMVRHPSALAKFDHIVKASMGKQIVMFLDYDGTLSPIVDDPDSAFMSDQMRAAVSDVAKCFPTAIVSGRCTDKVISFVRLAELYYAGSHGMDITGPVKVSKCTKAQANEVLYQPASEFLPMIDEVYEALLEKTKSTPGAKVENNKFCVSVHFRCVDEKRWSALAEQVKSVLKEYPKLRISHGRKVIEVRPTIKWDKGKALEFLLNTLGYADCSDVFPVYIGDDRTDEDAFKVLRDRGQGLGILVSSHPKETNASYSLQEPAEASICVMDFLLRLVEWKCLVQGLAKRRYIGVPPQM